MKLYMLLLALRDRDWNVTRVSYSVIREYTGMRKEDISVAVQLLQGAQLIRLARDEEVPLKGGNTGITATSSADFEGKCSNQNETAGGHVAPSRLAECPPARIPTFQK